MYMDELLQVAAIIGVSLLFLVFLMVCVFVIGSSIMLLDKSVEWLEEKIG